MSRHLGREDCLRTLLRVIAIRISFQITYSILLIRRMALLGGIGELSRSGVLGPATILGWLLTLSVGPFAVVQLWRIKESGRKSSLLLSAFAFAYYAAGLLFLRGAGAETAKIAVPILGNLLLSLLLVSSPVRRVCQNLKSTPNAMQPLPCASDAR
jgi:hypothetical protein